jgi:hypothetical protein
MAILIPGSPDDPETQGAGVTVPPLIGSGPQEPQGPKPAAAPNPYASIVNEMFPPTPQIRAPEPQQVNPYARALEDDERAGDQLLMTSFAAAAQSNPAVMREAETLAKQIGIPIDNAYRNMDVARVMLQRQQLESQRIQLLYPTLARQLRDPEFAKMALDDWDNLGIFERTAKAYELGRLQDERGKIGSKFMLGLEDPADTGRLAEISERMAQLPPSEGFLASSSEIVGGMVQTGAEALAVGGLFAGAATLTGPAAPVASPVAFGIGAGSVLFGRTAQVESGSSYLDLVGRGVDPSTARWAAMGVGAVNGALELVGARYLAAPFKATIGKVTRETLADALIRPTIGRAAGKAAISYVKGTSAEVATEVMQEVSNIVAEGSTAGDWEGVGKRLGEVAIKTAQGMALLGLPGPGMQFAHESSRVEKAKQSAVKFKDMQDKAAASNLKQGNPEAFQGHAEKVLEGTGAETIWMHASDVEEVLRQGGGTVEAPAAPLFDDLDKLVPGFSAAVRAEAARGGDIVMPSAVFLAKLTGTRLGDALTPHVRFAEADMSPHEAELAEPDIKEQEKAVVEQAADIEQRDTELAAIEAKLTEELVAAGRTKQVAAVEAQLWTAIVRTQTEKGEQTPAQFVAEHPLRVLAGEVVQGDAAEVLTQVDTDTDAFRTFFEGSKVVDEAGKPLTVYHGTAAEFTEFDASKIERPGFGMGFHFAEEPDLAGWYAEQWSGGQRQQAPEKIVPVLLSIKKPFTGNYYQFAADRGLTSNKAITEALIAEGYDGIRYNHGKIGRLGEGPSMAWVAFKPTQIKSATGNRGAFDPNDPNILHKREGETTQGFYRPSDATIFLTQAQDGSSFVHELWHRAFYLLGQMAQQKVSPQIVDDWNSMLSWLGVTQAEWDAMSFEQKKKHHEAVARTGEVYLWEGKAPSAELEGVFARLAKWMRAIYGKIAGVINAQYRAEFGVDLPALTPEVRAVMGRILASAESVQVAQTIEGAVPTFQTQEESGLNDEQWAEHQKQQQAADDAAISKLTAESLGNMRWLSRAKGKRLRDAQKAEQNVRDAIRGAVAAEVQQQPVYRASRWLKTGEFVNPDGTHTVTDGTHKIRTEEVAALGAELPGMTKADGISADAAAQMFGFESGEQLVTALREALPINDAIENAIDAKMMAEHSELADPKLREAAVDASLHNEARRRFVASELHALTKSLQPVRVTLAAAKEAARRALEQTQVRQLTPRAFTTAARRASIEAQRASAKGDTRAAIQWKRRQLVQEQMADLAEQARKDVAKAVRLFRKFGDPDKKLAKSRDIDLVTAARTLAAAYGLGPKIPEGQRTAQATAALQAIEATSPAVARRLAPLLADARQGGLDYRNLTLAQFREVVETGTQLWEEAKAARTIDAEGKKVELATAVEALAAGIAARPPRRPSTAAGAGETPPPFSRLMLRGWQALASLKRVEHWARFMDGGKDGPFQRYLVAPIMRAGVAYRKVQSAFVFAYHKHLNALRTSYGEKWNARYYSKELDFTFRGAKELVGALLHAGTNKQKLLLGRKGKNGVAWGELVDDGDGGKVLDSSRFDRAIAEAFEKGWLTKEAVEFVKFVHGSYAEHLPQAQKTHKAMFGYEFETLVHNTIATPFGDIDGGYVPARVDHDEAAPRVELGSFEDLENNFRQSLKPPGNKGFTLARNENYNQPLILDLGKQLSAIDEEMRFIYLQPAVRDAQRIINDRDFQRAIEPYDRAATNSMLMPWLDNTARQTVSRPSGVVLLDIISSWLRHASSLTALGFSVINAAIQASGISSARTQVQGKYLRAALIQWVRHPIDAVRAIAERSEFMQQRFDTQTRKLRDDIAYMTSDKALRGVKVVQQAAARGAFFLQRLVQGSVDVVTWQGGYAEAIASGKSEVEAVEAADSAVRRAQGSTNPEDLPAYETGTPFVRLFSQFGSFSNVMLNQIMGAQPGWDRVKAIGWALFVPALLEGVIRTALMGGPEDDDEDGTVDEWFAVFGRNIARNVAGLVPGAGPVLMALAESEGSRVQTPFEVLGRATRGMYEFFEAAGGDEVTASEAKAVAAFLTIATGLPIAAPTRYVLPAQSAGAR